MAVPYTFAGATSAIPLSQLDTNFATTFTLGNTAIQLGNTVTTLNNMTLANVTISSGNVTITNVSVTTANVTTGNITTLTSTNATITNMSSGNVTITGGTINGTTLGATTASSANVTTLTTSSTVTLNGGTANGVAYLNGSKVLTTGSALSFDGTNLVVPAEVYRNTASGFLRLSGGDGAGSGANVLAFGQSHATNPNRLSLTAPGTTSTSYIDFSAGGGEQMRLTSTGLGIGTSSPGVKLDVSGADGVRSRVIATSGGTSGLILSSAGNTAYTIKAGNADNSLRIDQDGTDRLTLASGGNLGLGTTTPTNSAGYSTLSLNGSTGGQLVFQTGGTYKQSIYSSSTDLNFYNSVAGNLAFFTNATERARITSGGQLLVKTTADNGVTCHFNGGANANIIRLTGASTTNSGYIGMDGDNFTITTGASILERARITSGGNLLVGTTTNNASGGVIQVSNGITFPAAQSASSDANTLDDYEEGDWTPVISDGTNNATMDIQTVARYTKTGNTVNVRAYVQTSSLGSVSGAIRITGLPFSALSTNYAGSVAGYAQGLAITAGQSVGLYIQPSVAYIDLRLWDDAAGTTQMQASEWSADGGIIFSITYSA